MALILFQMKNFLSIDKDNRYKNFLNNVFLNVKQVDSIIAGANVFFALKIKVFQKLNYNLIKIM